MIKGIKLYILFYLCISSTFITALRGNPLKSENFLLTAGLTTLGIAAYTKDLNQRWHIPSNEEEFLKKTTAAQEYGEKTGDYNLLTSVTDQDFKKDWRTRNPFKSDLLNAVKILTAVHTLVTITNRFHPYSHLTATKWLIYSLGMAIIAQKIGSFS